MPSNKVYIKEAEALAAELAVEVVTGGLSNAQLASLVSDLKAQKVEADEAAEADSADEAAEADSADEAAEAHPYAVAKGKSITSKRGILADGDEIKASDLAGGQDALDAFVKSGHVAKA